MQETSIFWLRAAVLLYALGLAHAILTVLGRRTPLGRLALAAFKVGVILHLVAIVELGLAVKHLPVDNFYETSSVCAFLIAGTFLILRWRYEFESLALFVFPLVFVMTLVGATEVPLAGWSDRRVRDVWLVVHVFLILLGYASLLVTALSSAFYLVQERRLKSKRMGPFVDRLPPLGTLDTLVTRSMELAFVFITLGLIAASTWAFVESGTRWIREAKIVIAFLTWMVCLIMVFLRTAAGWRGRKAALLAATALCFSAITWASHVGLRSLLKR